MKVKITFEVEMGNDTMQTGRDVVNAFMDSIRRIRSAAVDLVNDDGKVMDDNGNSVGKWSVEID